MPNERDGNKRRRVAACLFAIVGIMSVLQSTSTRWALESGRGSALVADSRLILQDAMRDIAASTSNGGPNGAQVARAVAVARSAPMLPEPFLVAAIAMDEAGDARRAEELLLAARIRDPRSPAVRFMLADHYRRTARDGDALSELAVLMRLQPQRQLPLLPYFAELAIQAEHRPALGRLILADPAFGRQILAAAASRGAPSAFILSLGARLPEHIENRAWQTQLIDRSIERGDYATARMIRRSVAGPASEASLLINPKFEEIALPAPFDWTLFETADGIAQAQPKGQLSLLYFGRNPTTFASQLTLLEPGAYRLRWTLDGRAVGRTSFQWQSLCVPDGTILGEAKLSQSPMQLTVPEGCPAQRFQLTASPLGAGVRQSATISDLALERLP